MLEPLVRNALLEDLGRAGDVTTDAIVPATAPAIAATGVDFISAGWLTHSVAALDIGLDDM
ncbi:hypothetical protein [Plastoroseomonas hellenica]|nr:hypothetical protein [Plastoroseomonas hellenica]